MTRNRRLVKDKTVNNKCKTIQIDKRMFVISTLEIMLFVMLCLVTIVWSVRLTDEQRASVVSALCFLGFLATNAIENKTTVEKIMFVLWIVTIVIIKFIV